MSEADYGVSYIASAPDELKVGDRVEVVDKKDALYKQQGIVIDIQEEGDIYVKFHTSKHVKYKLSQLRKLPDTPEELKVGDRVEVENFGNVVSKYVGKQGFVKTIPVNGRVFVDFGDESGAVPLCAIRKLPNPIFSIYAKIFEDSDNVKAFKTILNEMAETYKAKDADYGSAYDDGYRLFGHTQLLSRIYEKFSRVKHLLDGNKPNVAENVCDTLTDMAVQAICLRMLLQKNDFENVE